MSADEGADFVVLVPSGPAHYANRQPNESIYQSIRQHVPDLGTQGIGRCRLWFSDLFGPDLLHNRRADMVIARLGYVHPTGWYGPVAVSMEEDPATGEIPPLSPEILAIIDSP